MGFSLNRGGSIPEFDPKGPNEAEKSFWRQSWGGVRRAVVGCTAAVVFGLAILVVSLAAAADPLGVSPHEDMASESGEIVKIEYYLPYPGMLPDSPWYKLKAARDRVSLWLIFDPERKAAKELFLADKRINAAVFLAEGGKEDLAVSTATKASKYIEQAVNRAVKLAEEGKDVKSLLNTLATATAKHGEILSALERESGGAGREALARTEMNVRIWHERAEQALMEAE